MSTLRAIPAIILASFNCCFASEIVSDGLVRREDTVIDAILAVGAAIESASASKPGEPIVIVPLSTNDASTAARNMAVNRELFWFGDPKRNISLKDGGVKRPSRQGGSHLWCRNGANKSNLWWYKRLREKRDAVRSLKGKEVDIVMIGDSITYEWDRLPGSVVLDDLRRTYSVLNLGYGGDRFQQALWRAKYGELDGYSAKCVTLLIGTNNTDEDIEYVADGIIKTVSAIREKQPGAKVLLMAIFPRCPPSEKKLRERSLRVTDIIRKHADGRNVFFCDFRDAFLNADSSGRFDLLLDGTHPGRTGIRVWRDLMLPYFERFTGKRHVPNDPKRKPFERKWISYTTDIQKPGSVAEAAKFMSAAAKAGYNGICMDAFGEGLDGTAAQRLEELKEAAAREKLAVVPVMRQMPDESFERSAANIERVMHPAHWMVVTNGMAHANRAKLKEAAIRQIGMIRRISPESKQILHMKPLSGHAEGIPRDVVMASQWTDTYFHDKGWPIAVLGLINNPIYSLHHTCIAMRKFGDDDADTAIYWTDIGDYRLLVDFARLALKRE